MYLTAQICNEYIDYWTVSKIVDIQINVIKISHFIQLNFIVFQKIEKTCRNMSKNMNQPLHLFTYINEGVFYEQNPEQF